MIYAACVGVAVRLVLAWTGVGARLAWRIEVSTPANSNLELREGLALYSLGVSPYSGSSCRTTPLVLWLYGALADHDLLYILPNTLLDLVAALLLHRLAIYLFSSPRVYDKARFLPANAHGDICADASSSGARTAYSRAEIVPAPQAPAEFLRSSLPAALAWAYLLNPFTLMASAGGTTSSLENLAVVAALYGACTAQPALAVAGLAAASYMSLHAAVLLLPVACLLSYGPEDVATPLQFLGPWRTAAAPANGGQGEDVGGDGGCSGVGDGGALESNGSHGCARAADAASEGGDADASPAMDIDLGSSSRKDEIPGSGTRAPATALVRSPAATPQLPLLPWRTVATCVALTAALLFLLILASDLFLLSLPSPPGVRMQHDDAGGGAATTCVVAAAERLLVRPPQRAGETTTAGTVAAAAARRLAAARESLAACWAVRVYGSQVLMDDATPTVGIWWYLVMEGFQDSLAYVRLLAHSLLFALVPPLAIRLGTRRPLALFLVQLLCLGLTKPYPSVADLGLAAPLLLLLGRQQLAAAALRLLLPAGLALLCVLGPAMQRMWLSYESANSNFLYSVTLVYGIWQVVLLGQVLGLTVWLDRVARGKARLDERLAKRLDEQLEKRLDEPGERSAEQRAGQEAQVDDGKVGPRSPQRRETAES